MLQRKTRRLVSFAACVIFAVQSIALAHPVQNSSSQTDFRNFSYPVPSALRVLNRRLRALTLRDGVMAPRAGAPLDAPPGDWGAELRSLTFGDVTGDGTDEALVVINVPVCCQGWGSNCIYVYGLGGSAPRLLFSMIDGDRANGGLRDLYAEGGRLVIELWGRESIDTAACCAEVFTRRTYGWTGRRFRLIEVVIHPNPDPSTINDGYRHLKRP